MNERDKLKKLINEADELMVKGVTDSEPEFTGWLFKVKKYINDKYGENSFPMNEFNKIKFSLGLYIAGMPHSDYVDACCRGIKKTKEILNVYYDELVNDGQRIGNDETKKNNIINYNSIFIVHGHDEALKEKVARIIEKQNIKAIILCEQTNKGKTIIEKFEEYADVPCAICLFTKDDIAVDKSKPKELLRARQNVVFETGYFMGKIGRDKVIILADSEIDMPSDLGGVLYISNNNWETDVLKELRRIGYSIDMNKL
ncbi:MAG: nucleotide-binding protein [Clostridia bacterium]|nr:nucleotide-binding protein [Clostridia bacterium]